MNAHPRLRLPPRAVTVPTGLLAMALVLFLGGVALIGDAPAWQLALAAALGWWLADAATLLIHWTFDNYLSPQTPLLGPSVLAFRRHHSHPRELFARDWFDGNFENALLSAAVLGAAAPWALHRPAAAMLLAAAGLGGANVTLVHKWAHQRRPPPWARTLQRAGLLVDLRHHREHHRDGSRRYALLAGHVERLVEPLGLLALGEAAIYVLTGHIALEGRLKMSPEPRLSRRLEQLAWRAWYQGLAWYSRRVGARFYCMNWGYAAPGVDLRPPERLAEERLPLQLYAALVDGIELSERDIADVSCGRGGGLAFLHEAYGPASSLGVDLTPGNLRVCAEHLGGRPGLSFVRGDATALPLADQSVDVVLSVEASHCYPDAARFVAEAARALRPGGALLWTDFRPAEQLPAARACVDEALWRWRTERDITPEVLAAMQEDAPRRQALIAENAHPALRPLLRHFAAADEHSDTVRRFTEGRARYFLYQLERR
ncbi:MAG: methyltransferase domain-containing protein [Alphaproteobacteria bacterium]|nr:methyltransferase domain-containing protein [Alphaproteobacteria bacterium]